MAKKKLANADHHANSKHTCGTFLPKSLKLLMTAGNLSDLMQNTVTCQIMLLTGGIKPK